MRTRLSCLVAVVTALSIFVLSVPAPDFPPSPLLVINEVAWAGSRADHTAEWIELFNPSETPLDLDGWRLLSSDSAPNIRLRGVIEGSDLHDPSSGFFLLERENDDSVPEQTADLIYNGALDNDGETLMLINPAGIVVDTANAPLSGTTSVAWPAGSGVTYVSMERVDFRLPDTPSNWASASWIGVQLPQTPSYALGTPAAANVSFNVPPEISLHIVPPIPQPEVSTTFSAAGTHDLNDAVLSYVWAFGDGATAEGPEVTHVYDVAGTYRLVLTVTDAHGASTQLSQDILVQMTRPPVPDFSVVLPADEETLRAGMPIVLQDESGDEDSPIESWAWDFGDGTPGSGASVAHEYASAGIYKVTLRVRDAQLNTSEISREILVSSQLPVLEVSIPSDVLHSATPIRFDASASRDPDGHIVTYRWDFDGDGRIDAETSDGEALHTYAEGGSYVARLEAVDDQHQVAVVEIPVHVNAIPIAQFQLSSFTPRELENVVMSDRSLDPDGHIVRWSWHFGDAVLSAERSPRHAYLKSGEQMITLRVMDNSGATHTASAVICVENLPPRAVLSPLPPSVNTGDMYTFDASLSMDESPNGEIVKYEWDMEGRQTFEHETTTATFRYAYSDNGSYSIRVRVTDSEGAQHVSQPRSLQVCNRPPQATRITWSPQHPVDGQEVMFTAQGRDPDGELRGWSWILENGITGASETFSHVFQDDGIFEISLQVRDDDGATSVPLKASITVGNASPIAEFSALHDASCEVEGIRFDATQSHDPSPQGEIVHVGWDFGDGSTCPGNAEGCYPQSLWTPIHCYSEPGTYIVTLFVIDDQGNIGNATKTIQIAE